MSQTKCFERVSWKPRHMEMLLDMWEENIPMMKYSHRYNATIFSKMALDFERVGFRLHWSKVNTKINHLIRRYKAELKKRGKPDVQKDAWPFFKRMHKIMSLLKSNNSDDMDGHCEDPSDTPSDDDDVQESKVYENFKTEPDDNDGRDQIPWCSVNEPICKIETYDNDGLNENSSNTTSAYEINYINETDKNTSNTPLLEEPVCNVQTDDNDGLNENPLNTSSVYETNFIKETGKNTSVRTLVEAPICKIETDDYDRADKPYNSIINDTMEQSFHEDCRTQMDSNPKKRPRFSNSIRKEQLNKALVKYRSGAKYRAAVAKNQAKNPEVHRAAAKKYQAKNPEAHRAAVAKYQAKKREARRAAAANNDQIKYSKATATNYQPNNF